MIGVGHDLQLIKELEDAPALRAPGVFFTTGELRRSAAAVVPAETLAGVFAAKEALFKALPAGCPMWFWTDAELVHDQLGAPQFRAHGPLAGYLARHRLRIHVSISHSGGFVSSVVVIAGHAPAATRSATQSTRWSDMLLEESRLSLPVRPNDLDQLGHVNNAIALEYLEAGRWDWLDQRGFLPGGDRIAVVARIEIDYRTEIPRGQVEVCTRFESPTAVELGVDIPSFRARFRQRIHLPRASQAAVDALVTVAFLDAGNRCLVSVQDFLATALPALAIDTAALAGSEERS